MLPPAWLHKRRRITVTDYDDHGLQPLSPVVYDEQAIQPTSREGDNTSTITRPRNLAGVWTQQLLRHPFGLTITSLSGITLLTVILVAASALSHPDPSEQASTVEAQLLQKGRYLATIGACAACHTPPDVSAVPPAVHNAAELNRERQFRTDPDWYQYLDPNNQMAGGVPFIIRFSKESSGIVYSSNLTPDNATGLGSWSIEEIMQVIRTGKRPDGTSLFLFAPHTFFKNLSEEDARALAVYLKHLPARHHKILPASLPFPTKPAASVSPLKVAPTGRSQSRALYLMDALVGCRECHAHHADGKVQDFVGGDPGDPFIGVFRLGPDLPLRQEERGLAAFPYPGYAVLYGGNLTRYGLGGDRHDVSTDLIVRAIRQGISTEPDAYGRPRPLAHVMLWQFYSKMTDDDAYSIAEYLKTLKYVPHVVEPNLRLFGTDWEAAFEQVYGEKPSAHDAQIFGKQLSH